MNFNRGKMAAAAVLAATLLVVSGVTGYGLSRAGTVGQPFADDGRLKVMTSFYPCMILPGRWAAIRSR